MKEDNMAFDVIFATAVAKELDGALAGARVEKVYQPSKEEILLFCRVGRETKKLIVSSSPASARVCFTETAGENPAAPPMFCMLLRKHLAGAQIESVETVGFERAIKITFACRDELGFECRRYLIAEIMGKYSNIIFAGDDDGKMKILGVTKPVDMTTSRVRQLLPGMIYQSPPPQDKVSPLDETEEGFLSRFENYPQGKDAERFFIDAYLGFSPVVAREIVHRAGCDGMTAGEADAKRLASDFLALMEKVKNGEFVPYAVYGTGGEPEEFSYTEITYLPGAGKRFESFSDLLSAFYGKKAEAEALKNRVGATEALIVTAKKRLTKKLDILSAELEECKDAEKYRRWGELITGSLYMLTGKAGEATVTDYYSDPPLAVTIPLDEKLTASQNAARYYKKYNKLKTARTIAAEQAEKARAELEYLKTVEASLALCECAADVSEIREELMKTGYLRRPVQVKGQKPKKTEPMYFHTSLGREIICGKNNTQNDFLSTKLAEKSDWWFHVKGGAGSHVIMRCGPDEDPDARDFTEAAQAAAFFSDERASANVAVDYTLAKFVKKPSGSAPGHVIYTDYYTAYVNPAKPKGK